MTAAAMGMSSKAYLSVHNMDLSAVVVVDAGKLQADVAPSNDRQLLGQAGQVEDLVRDDGMLSAIIAAKARLI